VAEAPLAQATLQPLAEHSHLGVPQLRVALEALPAAPENAPLEPRPRCASAFARVVEVAQLAAASAGNLQRLVTEYRRTDRRARALENVVLPEVEQRLQRMAAVLEDLELEEVARVRLAVARQVT
jgi:V/A-type H+-transporting ATPase subunit D